MLLKALFVGWEIYNFQVNRNLDEEQEDSKKVATWTEFSCKQIVSLLLQNDTMGVQIREEYKRIY